MLKRVFLWLHGGHSEQLKRPSGGARHASRLCGRGVYSGSVLALHSLGRQIESLPGLVMLKLFIRKELLWSGTTVGGWACPADVLESIFIDGYRN